MLLVPAVGRADSGRADRSGSNPDSRPQRIVFQDNFDGSVNQRPDLTKWTFDVGHERGWGNKELQSYESGTDVASLDGNGHLRITANRKYAPVTGQLEYTSARLRTLSYPFMYGRAEARIKVPPGQGLWPAFWMLGFSPVGIHWPNCGEIDIMEAIGRTPNLVYGSIHGPVKALDYNTPPYHKTASFRLPKPASDDFHIYSVDSSPGFIQFSIDGRPYQWLTKADFTNESWVYDRPFELILNLAIGGNFPGQPTSRTHFPATMLVDYVRVTTNS